MSEQLHPHEHPYRDMDDTRLNNAQLRARLESTMLTDKLRRADKADRSTVIVDTVIQALDIAPPLNDVIKHGELVADKQQDTERLIKVATTLDNAQTFIHERQQTMNRREFGDMMMDIIDAVQANQGNTNLHRTLTHLQATIPTVYRDELIEAHRLLVVALYIETNEEPT